MTFIEKLYLACGPLIIVFLALGGVFALAWVYDRLLTDGEATDNEEDFDSEQE